jgi:tetratricopeptide (TPR) repeat protein
MQSLEKQGLNPTRLVLWVRLGGFLINFYNHLGDPESARQVVNQVEGKLEVWKESSGGMRRELAYLHLFTGDVIVREHGSNFAALEHYRQGLEFILPGEDSWEISLALEKVSLGYDQVGDRFESGRCAEQALVIQRTQGDPRLKLEILESLFYFFLMLGDYVQAFQVANEVVECTLSYNTRLNQAHAKYVLANAHFFAGQFEQARHLLDELIIAWSIPSKTPSRLFARFLLEILDLHVGDYEAFSRDTAFTGDPIDNYYRDSLRVFKGQYYLLSDDWDLAEQELVRYYKFILSIARLDMLGQPLALLGYIAYRRGDRAKALDYLAQALENGIQKGFFAVFLLALSVLAVMLAESGELEQAVELYAAVTAHPFARNSQWFEDMFGKPLKALWAGLSPEIISAAQERGSQRKLREVGKDYLEKLQGGFLSC